MMTQNIEKANPLFTQGMLIDGILKRIEDRYNPENDTIPGAPSVTWSDRELADALSHTLTLIGELYKKIRDQQTQIENLSATVDGIYARGGRRLS